MAGVPANAGALVGKRLGSYELVALLALGGTAEIYLARIDGAAGFEKYVVVKCLHDHLAEDREFVQMFLDEARLGAQLDHSNIVQTLGLGEQDGRYYLVMEFIAGMSLALLARRAVERVPGGRIPVPLVLGIAVQACAGLHYAHTRQSGGKPLNLVHRDISPQNLVVTFEGDVRIVDFGIAKAEDRETATKSGTIKGKFAYMSPEQCHAKNIDHRTDVFALGVVVHELLTGRRLFKRASAYETYQAILECKVPAPSAVNHELDPALDAVVMKALTKNLKERYASAEAFGEALTGYLHTRGKLSGSGEISNFIGQYFVAEIEDHGDRMRELLEGRPAGAAASWDFDGAGSSSLDRDDAEELSQFEVIDSSAASQDAAPADPDELPVDATRIEMNPMALMANLEAPRVPPGGPVAKPSPVGSSPAGPPSRDAQPSRDAARPALAPVRTPSFGSQGDASSIFGGAATNRAATAPASPHAKLPALPRPGGPRGSLDMGPGGALGGGGPLGGAVPTPIIGKPTDRTAPTGLPSLPNRSREETAPAAAPHPGPGFGAGAGPLSTVIMDPPVRTPPGMRSFPEAHTVMAPLDSTTPPPGRAPQRDLPASFETKLDDGPRRTSLPYNATVPAMDAMDPELAAPPPATDQPTYRAPFIDPLMPFPSETAQPFPSETAQPFPSGGHQPFPSGDHQPFPSGDHLVQPFPSGELLVPANGTPPSTSSIDGGLPAHLIGLPPPTAYPRFDPSFQHPKVQRGLPRWIVPAGIAVAATIVIGVIAAVAG